MHAKQTTFTVKDAAQLFDVSTGRIRQLIREGRITATKGFRGQYFINREEMKRHGTAVRDKLIGFLCSFCGKSESIAEKVIAGPSVFICDQCVWLCAEILEEAGIERSAQE